MKAAAFVIFWAAVLAGCGHPDPIDRIIDKAFASPGPGNGPFTPIPLPATASVTQVLARTVVGNSPILEIRQVNVSGLGAYTAVLVGNSPNQKVVLLQFQPDSLHPPGGWWSRPYDLNQN